ncbi:MAG: metal ABC transporter ATP-binding protein [Acidobacteria bacterium]|nr:MAG: metal ABC transporter ATP-binding protein [Acidobacteriota bacterium]
MAIIPKPITPNIGERPGAPGSPSDGEWAFVGSDLAIGYGRPALFENLSFEIRRGEILGIVGPNGSGKTTLLRTILGLLKPVAGRVARWPGLNISYVPQRDRIDAIVPVTALEVVTMGMTARADAFDRIRAADRRAASQAMELLGIEALGGRLFRNLSAGQKQRVLLAKALAASPDVLVLDEPTSGMDIASEAAILDFLRALNTEQHVTVAIVTHMLPIVLNLATTIMLVSPRGIVHGAAGEVLQEERLTAVYGVPVHLGQVAGQMTLVVGDKDGGDV